MYDIFSMLSLLSKFLRGYVKGSILRALMIILLSLYKKHAYECVEHKSFDTLVIYIWFISYMVINTLLHKFCIRPVKILIASS